jgi:transposase
MSAAFIGLDLAKSVFQVHGVDGQGKVVVTKRLRRDAVLAFFANLAGASRDWGCKRSEPFQSKVELRLRRAKKLFVDVRR